MAQPRHFLDHPEARAVFVRAEDLVAESDRGAVLISTELVAQQLEMLFRSIAPSDMPSKRIESLLTYPGVLGGLAARIDVALLCGLVGSRLGKALHGLRKLRNDAAHSDKAFSLRKRWHAYRAAFDLAEGLPEWINRTVLDVTMKEAVAELQAIHMPEDLGGEVAFETPEEVLQYLREHPDVFTGLRETMPRRELALATSMMCGLIIHSREKRLGARQAATSRVRDPESSNDSGAAQ